MSSSHNPPRRRPPKPLSSQQAADFHDWGAIPPPKRDQRPRPVPARSPVSPVPVSESPMPVPGETRQAATGSSMVPPQSQQSAVPAPATRRPKRFNRWVLWAFVTVAGLGGIAGASAVSLLRIPNLPNCRAIFWPLASAATRLQCADAYADQGSVESLLAAIALVEALPEDHPLRTEIDERVERWADTILHIADQTFNQGELEEAIRFAQQIPANTAAADEVSDRVRLWKDIWSQAESIFREAEGHLRASQFREAFTAAIQLRSIDNEYWSGTRYEELVSLISRTREEVNILASAERQAEGGTVEAILDALKQVMAIEEDSYVYGEAQNVLKRLSRNLLDLAETALSQEDSAEALRILGQIPPAADLSAEVADFRTLIDAYELTWSGTTAGFEAAIVRLQSISSDRPLYGRAQELKETWRGQLQGLAQLNWARQVARAGTVDSLRAAIAEAEKIDGSNPTWEDTQAQIDEWRTEIARIEDQPRLDRAKLIAITGDRASLAAAIAEAGQISSESALYDEAQDLIGDWRWRLQRLDHEPILAQARQLANTGQIAQAIEVASRIPADQALYEEAQTAIADWQTQQVGQQSYQEALQIAQAGTVDALVEAIVVAQNVPSSSPDWTLAQRAVNEWSWNLLEVAEATAIRNLAQGITIASQIPPRTEAYAEAQLRIRDWQSALERTF